MTNVRDTIALEAEIRVLKENGNYAFNKSMEWKHKALDYKEKLEKIEAYLKQFHSNDDSVWGKILKEKS